MLRRHSLLSACGILALFATAPAAAQEAVTITGHVSSGNMPLQGASVRIDELDLGATTNADGRYSFIVPSSRVRGQTVTMTARYLRFQPQSVRITLVGGSLVQDFVLSAVSAPQPDRPVTPRVDTPRVDTTRAAPGAARVIEPRVSNTPMLEPRLRPVRAIPGITLDSAAFLETAGATDLPGALAGRLAGVEVQTSTTPGGTSAIQIRGPRTLLGRTQPLFVVNGIIVDNGSTTTTAQRTGRGGFDYGTAIADLNLEDISSVKLLTGPMASMLYGGRAANGVLLVTTRNGAGLSGFDISASQQFTRESPLRQREFQNSYGQGLGGAFSFFNGKGGGINDSVSQSWGPALIGQPIAQASLNQSGRAEVLPWIAHPGSVSDYFENGRTLATNVAAQGSNDRSQFRLSIANRSNTGLTPDYTLSRQSATLTAGTRPSPRLELGGDLQFYRDKAEDRPGSGFDESNPVSVFTMMGRQVDVAGLRTHLRDAANAQISWNYSTHNNPYFAPLVNANDDSRSRILGGASATYALATWLQGTARFGADHYSDDRHFTVASGWLGGFPWFAGRGDFSTGGSETDAISMTGTNAEVLLRATPATSGTTAFGITVGAGRRSNDMHLTFSGSDRTPAAVPPTPSVDFNGTSHTLFFLGGLNAMVSDYASLDLTARQESSTLNSGSGSQLYPSILASIDLARMNPSLRGGVFDALRVRGGWSRSGNDATPALLQQLGATPPATGDIYTQLAKPEITTGWEIGGEAGMLGNRLNVDLAYYNDRSESLILPLSDGSFARTGAVSNKGFQAQIDLVPFRWSDALEWRVGANFGKNTNLVESLASSVTALALGVSFRGVSLQARPGVALAAIVGTGYLRDATGQLVLRNGVPLPDSLTGPKVLGTSAPSWIGGLSSGIRFHGLDLSVLFDIRRGGKIFSASNMASGFAGVSAETGFRPDTGLLITGIDAATGQANKVHATTEAYYHALGAIGERWLYDASVMKLREARVSFNIPLHALGLHAQSLRASVIGRNLAMWTDAPDIDPETVIGTTIFRGAELGQLPTARSLGFQLTLTP